MTEEKKITKIWVGGTCGHWQVSNGTETIECDNGELHDVIDYLEGRKETW